MPTVETTIRVTIAERAGLGEAEQAVADQLQAAGRELLVGLCAAIETQVLAEASGLRPNKQRGRDLLTRFGWVRLPRWQLQDTTTGRYLCPVDAVLGLRPRQHASPWVLGQAVALATRVPYRQATQLLCGWLQDRVDHRTVFAWVRAAGAQVVAEEDQQQEAVFARGEPAACDATEREIVVAQVDGTFLKAQREAGADFELRLGVLCSGKVLESATAKHRRYRLTERLCYGGVEGADDFGERLFLAGEAKLGLTRARHLLLIGDGAAWIEALAGHERWKATYQLDWWHLTHAFHRTFPDRPGLVAELKQALYDGQGEQVVRLVGVAKALGVGDPDKVAQLEHYVRRNQQGFYSARRLRAQLSPQAQLVAVEGSGAVEKQMDLAIGRRFKGQGMRWTRKGANHLVKLRVRALARAA